MTDDLQTLELECGVTLELKGVNKMMLSDFFGGITMANGRVNPQGIDHATFNKLMRYVCGWGVATDVPPDEKQDYEMFGGARQQRAAWVREIATDSELSQIMARVLTLTLPQVKARAEQARQKEIEQTEIERLRARVAELEGEKV